MVAEDYILRLLGLESLWEIKTGDAQDAIGLMNLKVKGKLSTEITKHTKGLVT